MERLPLRHGVFTPLAPVLDFFQKKHPTSDGLVGQQICPPQLIRIEDGAKNDDGRILRTRHGIRFRRSEDGVHVRRHDAQIRVVREKTIELFSSALAGDLPEDSL